MSSSPTPYAGPLTNQIWQSAYISLGWLQSVVLASGASHQPNSLAANAVLVLDSLLAGVEILGVQSALNAINLDLPMLKQVASLPLTFSSSQNTTINGRISSLTALAAQFQSILAGNLLSGNPIDSLNRGLSPITSPNLLSIFSTWNQEPVPAGFTQATLPVAASGYSTDWFSITTGVAAYYGSNPQAPLDGAIRASQGALMLSSILESLFQASSSPSSISDSVAWNTAMALPASLASCNLLRPDVSLEAPQMTMATKAFLLLMSEQLASFILGVKGFASTAATTAANSVISQQGQGLMDIAAQSLGGFESWQGLVGSLPAPWGAGAIPLGTSVSLTSGSQTLTEAAVLGTDISLGPLGTAIPGWTGDLPLTLGLLNFRGALARRLSTTLGNLLYHSSYGSRIPPEIGQILTTGAQSLITAYGKSALASDPRTQAIISASTSMLSGQPNAAFFQALVQPIGPGLAPVAVNEVIAP